MDRRLAWTLPALLVLGCKPSPPQVPEDGDQTTGVHYGEAAYATSITPIQVCEHLARMVATEAGVLDPQLDPSTMAACDQELEIEAAMRGTANWNDIASCVLQAHTEPELDACDKEYPIPAGPQGWSEADIEQERAVCEHMLEVVMHETAAELGTQIPPLSDGERRGLSTECVESFLLDQRPNLDPSAYQQLLTCIANAQTGPQMQDC